MELDEYIREDMQSLRAIAARDGKHQQHIYDVLADAHLTQYVRMAMEEKLDKARSKGRGGWWKPDACPIERLRSMLRAHVDKGDMRDVINLAAMIYAREIADAGTA